MKFRSPRGGVGLKHVFIIAAGLLLLAGPAGVRAASVGPGDIENCDDCATLVNTDVNNTGDVTVTDLLIVLQDIRTSAPYDPNHDVNGDGVVNMIDFAIERKCLGCSVSPSPFS